MMHSEWAVLQIIECGMMWSRAGPNVCEFVTELVVIRSSVFTEFVGVLIVIVECVVRECSCIDPGDQIGVVFLDEGFIRGQPWAFVLEYAVLTGASTSRLGRQ